VLLETVRLFPTASRTYTKATVRQSTVPRVNSHTAVYGQSADDTLLLEDLRFFPAAPRTYTKATVGHSTALCELAYSGIWAVCRRHGVARRSSVFSGCAANLHEGHCRTQHCPVRTRIQRYMGSLQTTRCCSKIFGFFRLRRELTRRPLSDAVQFCMCTHVYLPCPSPASYVTLTVDLKLRSS